MFQRVCLLIGCRIELEDNDPKNPPFLINADDKFIQPVLDENTGRVLNVPDGQEVTIACPGKNNKLEATGDQVNSGSCVSGTSFQVGKNKTPKKFSTLGCTSSVEDTIKETGECWKGATEIQIGWDIGDDKFINQLTVCHNKTEANTLYVIDRINGPSIEATDSSNKRPSFKKGGFFDGININGAYSQAGQAVEFARILGVKKGLTYLNIRKQWYLARGHFAPDGDFIDAGSQDATYYYINTAPQWQSFNNGNWKYLETAVRSIASERNKIYTTYTGGFGVIELADKNGNMKPMYLAQDDQGNGIVPVPKYYWKVVHDPETKAATAFIGINNPHMTEVKEEDILCKDICYKVPDFISDDRRFNINAGYMFCCSVSSLRKAIPYVPMIGRVKVLV